MDRPQPLSQPCSLAPTQARARGCISPPPSCFGRSPPASTRHRANQRYATPISHSWRAARTPSHLRLPQSRPSPPVWRPGRCPHMPPLGPGPVPPLAVRTTLRGCFRAVTLDDDQHTEHLSLSHVAAGAAWPGLRHLALSLAHCSWLAAFEPSLASSLRGAAEISRQSEHALWPLLGRRGAGALGAQLCVAPTCADSGTTASLCAGLMWTAVHTPGHTTWPPHAFSPRPSPPASPHSPILEPAARRGGNVCASCAARS